MSEVRPKLDRLRSHKLREVVVYFYHKSCVREGVGDTVAFCSIYSQHHNLLTVPTFAFLLPHIFRLSELLREKQTEVSGGGGEGQRTQFIRRTELQSKHAKMYNQKYTVQKHIGKK